MDGQVHGTYYHIYFICQLVITKPFRKRRLGECQFGVAAPSPRDVTGGDRVLAGYNAGMKERRFFVFFAAASISLFASLCATPTPAHDWWKLQKSGTDASLRGVSVAAISYTLGRMPFPSPVVWVSGSKGTILRSMDQGETWQSVSPADSRDLDFRGVVAFDEKTAYAMASGEGDKSRVYKTTDGGATWRLQFTGDRKEFFLDSIACTSATHCYALGDPIGGKFTLLHTDDGEHWNSLPAENRPDALSGEGSFAASNSCLLLKSDDEFFFVTGGAKVPGKGARIFHTSNAGKSWNVTEPPIAQGNAYSGIFAIASDFDNKRIIVVGGDYKRSDDAKQIAAYSDDNGKTWKSPKSALHGFRSGVAPLGVNDWIAVGPNGADFSRDNGVHWKRMGKIPLNAIASRFAVWAVGPNGTIEAFSSGIALE